MGRPTKYNQQALDVAFPYLDDLHEDGSDMTLGMNG